MKRRKLLRGLRGLLTWLLHGMITASISLIIFDVKALEYFLKQKCQSNAEVAKPASPTTLGKEMAIFAVTLSRERKELSQVEMLGKFAGAVGNYNAQFLAYSDLNWPHIAEEFVKSLGLSFNPYVAQE